MPDYMSRHPDLNVLHSNQEEILTENYVNFLIEHSVPRSMTLDEIKEHTAKDEVLPSSSRYRDR